MPLVLCTGITAHLIFLHTHGSSPTGGVFLLWRWLLSSFSRSTCTATGCACTTAVPASPAAALQLLGMLFHRCTLHPGSGIWDPGSRPGTPYPGSRALGPWIWAPGPSWGGPSKGKYRVFGPSQGPWARAQRALLRVNIGYLGPPRGPGPGPRGRFERKYKGFGAIWGPWEGPGTPILGPILGPFWGPK